jgi:hypothetical protein
MYKVTFKGADGKQYTCDRVNLLPTDSMAEVIQTVSARRAEQGGDPNPLFITKHVSIALPQE